MLEEPITPEKQKRLEALLDRFREDALYEPDVSFLIVVKTKGHPQIMLEVGGDEPERERLMGFFLKWALEKSGTQLTEIAKKLGA